MTDNWPRYEPVTFTTAVNVSSEDLDTLNQAGLPKDALGVGSTLEVPVGVDVPGRGYLIHFAHGGVHDYYFDPSTEQVLAVDSWPGQELNLVNSTLGQFTNTEKAIIEAFPFYDDLDRDLNEVDVDTLAVLQSRES